MTPSAPYRTATREPDAFLPSLGWTRHAALVFALLGGAVSAWAIDVLLTDRDCEKQATPHFALAALVAVVALAAGAIAVRLQPFMIRVAIRPVRSRFDAVWVAAAALVAPFALALSTAGVSTFVCFYATFRLCFDLTLPEPPPFKLGC